MASIIPIKYLYFGGAYGNLHQFAKLLRIQRLEKLGFLNRIFRLFIFNDDKDIGRRVKNLKLYSVIEKLFFYLIVFVIVAHSMACFWIFISNIESWDNIYVDSQGKVSYMNWIVKGSFNSYNNYQIYSTSLYYTVTTISTVGYGDITGTNMYERFVCIFNQFLGVIFFSVISS
jgi:hypothetical protein